MASSTEHTPTGTLSAAEDLYIEGGPTLWFGGNAQHAPDANNYYWGIVGTVETPVYQVGCYENFQLADNLTVNEVRCDISGVSSDITRRNFLEATFDVQALLPLAQLRYLLRWSSSLSVPGEDTEYAGIGEINQQDFHMLYFSRIYDPTAGDYVSFTGHRCQFQQGGALQMRYGQPWIVGVLVRMYANANLPSAQRFATAIRYDPSVI